MNLVRTPTGIYPHGLGAKKRFFETDVEIWPNISLQRNMILTSGNKFVNLQGLLYLPPNLVNFGLETAENGWRFFAHCLNFSLGDTASLTTWTLYNRQQANFGTCYVVAWAYSLEQHNAGRAHAELCHASICIYTSEFLEADKQPCEYDT